MAFWAVFIGFGPLFYILWGSRLRWDPEILDHRPALMHCNKGSLQHMGHGPNSFSGDHIGIRLATYQRPIKLYIVRFDCGSYGFETPRAPPYFEASKQDPDGPLSSLVLVLKPVCPWGGG